MAYLTTSDGVRIFFDEAGSGFPVIFAHEFGDNYETWAPQMSHFGRRYRCIAPAARGFPPSEVPERAEQYTVARLIADIGELMDHLKLDAAHLVGISMGSVPMLNFALQNPQRVRSLVIASTGAGVIRDPAELEKRLAAVEQRAADYEKLGVVEMADRMANLAVRRSFKAKDPHGWAAFRDRMKKHSAEGCAKTLRESFIKRPSIYDQGEALRAFTNPTLLMFGDDDHPAVGPTLFMREHMPRAGLMVFPWSGHNLNIEEPAAFNRVLDDFFHSVEQDRWRPAD